MERYCFIRCDCAGMEQEQTISQPCVSVWAVLGTPSGDVVAAGSDGIIRVFTRDQHRMASPEDQAMFQQQVSATAIPS
jgi:phospholipase A-2-activating protein